MSIILSGVAASFHSEISRILPEADVASLTNLVWMARCSRRLVAEIGVNLFVKWRVLLVVTGVSLRDARMEMFKNIVLAGGK